jgi:hypothetical protein
MTASFREMAILMNHVDPLLSMRSLIRHHRWAEGDTPSQLSLQLVAKRHSHPDNIIRFLNYNTFLLDGFVLDLSLFSLAELINKMGLTIAEVYIRLEINVPFLISKLGINAAKFLAEKVGSETLAEILGVAGKVMDAFVSVLNFFTFGFIGWGKVAIEQVLDIAGIDDAVDAIVRIGITPLKLLEMLGIDPVDALAKCGFGIAQILGADISDPLRIGAKPALEQRAKEIGEELVKPGQLASHIKNYEIVSLNEVWFDEALKTIKSKTPGYRHIPGPSKTGSKALKGCGLLQLVKNRNVTETGYLVFSNRGDEFRDADYWASKGILLSRIDVGVGTIDLYSTHLYSGDGLLDFPELGLGKLSENEKGRYRNAQLDEFVEFFRKTHITSNVAIFCGDFNIVAENRDLISKMNSINLEDCAIRYGDTGGTHGGEDKGADRFAGICDLPVSSPYCPYTGGVRGGERIDYIFIEKPSSSHTFNLDVSFLYRRPFPRSNPTENQYFLSDHIGLEVTLFVSRK